MEIHKEIELMREKLNRLRDGDPAIAKMDIFAKLMLVEVLNKIIPACPYLPTCAGTADRQDDGK